MKYQDQPINPILLQQEGSSCDQQGLTKLEYFAAVAMHAIITDLQRQTRIIIAEVCDRAIIIASAMLNTLEEKKTGRKELP